MEFTLKPFPDVIAEVDERLDYVRSLGPDAPIRSYKEVYCSNLTTDPDELLLWASTLAEETSEISIVARSLKIDTHFEDKFNYRGLKKVSGWIMGNEVLLRPELGDRNEKEIWGTFLSTQGELFNFQEKTMGEHKIPSNSARYNSKLYADYDVTKLFKHAGLKEIRLESLKDSTGLIAVREHLAEFALKHNLLDKLKIN